MRRFGRPALLVLVAAALTLAGWRLLAIHPDAARPTAAVAALLALVVWASGWRGRRARRRARLNGERLVALAAEAAAAHARTLSVKRAQLVVRDEYGNYDYDRWRRHLGYFVERVVFREAGERSLDAGAAAPDTPLRLRLEATVEDAVEAYEAGSAPALDLSDVRSGEDYEHLCRAILEEAGWSVATTPASGDQGADLIAERAGTRLVIQCKFYARPVGNRAVQEAFAAKRFQGGDHAAVVSNSAFTRAAQQLAATNDVLLLHHDQLADFGARPEQAA